VFRKEITLSSCVLPNIIKITTHTHTHKTAFEVAQSLLCFALLILSISFPSLKDWFGKK